MFWVWSAHFWIWSRRPCAQGVGVDPCLLNLFKPFRSHKRWLGWDFGHVREDSYRFYMGFLQRDASMRALWSDRQNCSHSVSQKVKCIRHSFAPFRALLLFCALLRSFALICSLVRSLARICMFCVRPRLERPRLGAAKPMWGVAKGSSSREVEGRSEFRAQAVKWVVSKLQEDRHANLSAERWVVAKLQGDESASQCSMELTDFWPDSILRGTPRPYAIKTWGVTDNWTIKRRPVRGSEGL